MIILNTTYHVDCAVSGDFLDWVAADFLPHAMASDLVRDPKLVRVMTHRQGGVCYAIQLRAQSLSQLQQWNLAVGKELHRRLGERFGDKVAGFTTFMEEINLNTLAHKG